MGRVVVGVDGSEHGQRALRWARREAEIHGHELVALLAWGLFDQLHVGEAEPFDPDYGPADAAAAAVDASALEEAARHLLDRAVDAAEAQVPGVSVERVLVAGSTADGLLGAAKGADLVVVGSRGVGGFRGLLLGSISHQLAHHAPCPVVVIPPPSEATA